MEEWLTLPELAARLRVPLRTVYDWRQKGTGPTGYRVGKFIRVKEADLATWLDARRDADRVSQ
jgi:excisionase family DNA binding protein